MNRRTRLARRVLAGPEEVIMKPLVGLPHMTALTAIQAATDAVADTVEFVNTLRHVGSDAWSPLKKALQGALHLGQNALRLVTRPLSLGFHKEPHEVVHEAWEGMKANMSRVKEALKGLPPDQAKQVQHQMNKGLPEGLK